MRKILIVKLLNRVKGVAINLRPLLLGVVALWIGAIVSSVGVVYSTHKCRQLIHQLETAKREAAELQVEWGQYLLEQSTWAAYSRIEQVAVDKLDMQVPQTKDIVFIQ